MVSGARQRRLGRSHSGRRGVNPTDPHGPHIRFVITLDSDTRLPRETVGRLIGKMAHPLNRPRFDASRGRVVEGYAILQPRVTPALPVGREGSLFLRVFSSAWGIDPGSRADRHELAERLAPQAPLDRSRRSLASKPWSEGCSSLGSFCGASDRIFAVGDFPASGRGGLGRARRDARRAALSRFHGSSRRSFDQRR